MSNHTAQDVVNLFKDLTPVHEASYINIGTAFIYNTGQCHHMLVVSPTGTQVYGVPTRNVPELARSIAEVFPTTDNTHYSRWCNYPDRPMSSGDYFTIKNRIAGLTETETETEQSTDTETQLREQLAKQETIISNLHRATEILRGSQAEALAELIDEHLSDPCEDGIADAFERMSLPVPNQDYTLTVTVSFTVPLGGDVEAAAEEALTEYANSAYLASEAEAA